ncbi:protein OBERON 2 isoform X1 [Sesamum indicum]|uniref:protein OBERON 2 isoform X1 n=1 Tax=Sesamum indicum TaxID=4182 RepID=A0A6I9SNN9_SESIN|nr:protein OBERON 2 isoform X1 [Sesamum indicum]XP_011071592.1 protein OBERON 2 isoform X1 [Sesamum indicum]
MTSELQKESMDIDSPGGSKGSPHRLQGNGFSLYPVSVNDSGEGLPYAPEDWPNPGDKWGWKVGRRTAISGYYLDRYMYLPVRLREAGHKKGFASRLSVEQYIRAKFPDTDIDAFFASFSWRIPSKSSKKGDREMFRHPGETADDPGSDVHINGVRCKAGNSFCSSLAAGEDHVSEVMFCDICCSEPRFCRDCCCILCCRIIDKACDSYGYIRCEANIEGYACGHSCHIDCALRAYMAGTVGGSIGLDAEYYCRRCDSRTNLVSHVIKLLENCESIVSRDDIEKILKIGICVLRGSKKASAKQLLHHIELAMSKLKNGTDLEDIWKKEDVSAATAVGLSSNSNGALGFAKNESQDQETGSPLSSKFDHRVESLKLEDEVDQILDSLRKSQEIEYRLAEERLSAQKNYILNLYQQLNKERSDLSRHTSSEDQDSLLEAVLSRVDQVKREVSRLKDMAEVAKGFGRVPKHILKEQFDLDIEH